MIECIIRDKIKQYCNPAPQVIYCHFKEPTCDATILGLLLRALNQVELDPYCTPSATAPHKTIKMMRNSLKNLITWPEYLPSNSGPFSPPCHDGIASGCCKKPQWPAKQLIVDSRIDSNSVACASCKAPYMVGNGRNGHAVKCSPMASLRKSVDKEVETIQGLEYSKFVAGGNKEHFSGTPDTGSNLWNSLDNQKI